MHQTDAQCITLLNAFFSGGQWWGGAGGCYWARRLVEKRARTGAQDWRWVRLTVWLFRLIFSAILLFHDQVCAPCVCVCGGGGGGGRRELECDCCTMWLFCNTFRTPRPGVGPLGHSTVCPCHTRSQWLIWTTVTWKLALQWQNGSLTDLPGSPDASKIIRHEQRQHDGLLQELLRFVKASNITPVGCHKKSRSNTVRPRTEIIL